ncbi:hypothetical protein JTE90_008635 [Oedothorax gibbosus]|uniref:Uncharacterized protein n=1 Tax=Oedothorax gibbosus TaxID=931172 RepID=A0AAV6U1C1_9ARAC|nr:hypothetical protein JTE90_008635 [Oedothorax gibbosus]
MSARKEKAMILSSDEEDFVPLKRKKKSFGEPSIKKKKALKVDVNLSQNEPAPSSSKVLEPYSIYIGNNVVCEIKHFKNAHYLGLYKSVEGEIKNRFNINLKQILTVKRAIETMIEYCNANDFEI